jgi:hypothetical protein
MLLLTTEVVLILVQKIGCTNFQLTFVAERCAEGTSHSAVANSGTEGSGSSVNLQVCQNGYLTLTIPARPVFEREKTEPVEDPVI